ncbi:MAG: hypothetical protein U0003_02860 [Vampirovibrionales bacterium]
MAMILTLTQGTGQSDLTSVYERALHAAANAMTLDAFYGRPPLQLPALVANAFQQAVGSTNPLVRLDGLKYQNARAGRPPSQMAETLASALQPLTEVPDPLVSGEALFLLKQYPMANRRLDGVDGITPQGYLEAGDRLLAIQALTAAQACYQRGYAMEPLPALNQGLKRIQEKRRLAEQRINQGNAAYDVKNYPEALTFYGQAQMLYPDWDLPWIRVGDTQFALKQQAAALTAYEQAVKLNPDYLQGRPFKKRYDSLHKKVTPRV